MKKGPAGFGWSLNVLVFLVGSSPDVHLFGFCDKLVAEIRVGDGDDGVTFFPGGQALEVDLAVFGYQVVDVRAGVGNNGAWLQGWYNAGFHFAVSGRKGGGAADKALSAV